MECLYCKGRDSKGCPNCKGAGREDIEQCPLMLVTDDVWQLIELADLMEKGLPPVSGGALEQANSFIEACRLVWTEQRQYKNKLGIT